MNPRIAVDLHGDTLLETDIYPSTDELLALVCEQPFLINLTICHAHASLGVTQSEMEHLTGGCFKLL